MKALQSLEKKDKSKQIVKIISYIDAWTYFKAKDLSEQKKIIVVNTAEKQQASLISKLFESCGILS